MGWEGQWAHKWTNSGCHRCPYYADVQAHRKKQSKKHMYVCPPTRDITLHYIILHCITLHYIALHCIALHCITFPPRHFVKITFDQPFNYHSGLWLLLSPIIAANAMRSHQASQQTNFAYVTSLGSLYITAFASISSNRNWGSFVSEERNFYHQSGISV